MPTVYSVASHVLSRFPSGLSSMKLQKLVFLTKGSYLAVKNVAIFPEEFVLWERGPVCLELHEAYGGSGTYTVSSIKKAEPLLPEWAGIVDIVVDKYGALSGIDLKNLINEKISSWSDLNGSGYHLFEDEIVEAFSKFLKLA